MKVMDSIHKITDLLPKMLNYNNCLLEILEQRQDNINYVFTYYKPDYRAKFELTHFQGIVNNSML